MSIAFWARSAKKSDNVIRSYGNLISVREEKEAENGKIIVNHKYFDSNMNPHPVLSNYEKVVSRELPGIGYRFILGSEKDGYGVIDQDGNMIIPQRYDDINMVLGYWNLYAKVSYTRWYRNEAAQYVKKPGEFEKTARWIALGAAMAIQENGLIKREQSELVRSAERENGRAELNGITSIDWFAMLRGWEMARSGLS